MKKIKLARKQGESDIDFVMRGFEMLKDTGIINYILRMNKFTLIFEEYNPCRCLSLVDKDTGAKTLLEKCEYCKETK